MDETRRAYYHSLGFVAAPNSVRLKSGKQFDRYFPKPENHDRIEFYSNDVNDTVALMGKVVSLYLDDTKRIAPVLVGKSKMDTCRNVYQFIIDHIEYKLDKAGHEELRRPAVTWHTRRGDCDCMSIMASSILTNLGINHTIRIAAYENGKGFQHVYVIVPDGLGYITIDPVLRPYMLGKLLHTNMFNYEKGFIKKKDFTMQQLGIPVHVLSGIDNAEVSKVRGELAMTAKDYRQEEDPVLALFHDTRSYVSQYPEVLGRNIKATDFLQMLDYAINYWDTDQGLTALQALALSEQKMRSASRYPNNPYLNFFTKIYEGFQKEARVNGLGTMDGLFKNLKNKVKKVFTDVKTLSPLHAVMRAAFRGLIKVNYMGYATRFAIGKLATNDLVKYPKDEIIDFVDKNVQGVSGSEFAKYVKGYEGVKNFYRNAGGTGKEWDTFKFVIKEGKGKGAAVGKYAETQAQRKALSLIEAAIEKKYGKAILGSLDPDVVDEVQLGEPFSLAATIAAASTAIATVASQFKDVKDGAKIVEETVNDAKNVVDTIKNVTSPGGSSTKAGSTSTASNGKGGWLSKIKDKIADIKSGSAPYTPNTKAGTSKDNTGQSNTKKLLIIGGIVTAVAGGSLLAIRHFKNQKSKKGLSGVPASKKPFEVVIR